MRELEVKSLSTPEERLAFAMWLDGLRLETIEMNMESIFGRKFGIMEVPDMITHMCHVWLVTQTDY